MDSHRESDEGRFISEWYPSKKSLSRMGSISRDREYRERDDDLAGNLRVRDRDREHQHRGFFPPTSFADDSYIGYRRQSPELTRPSLGRGASFSTNRSAAAVAAAAAAATDEYDVVGHYNNGEGSSI